MKQGSIQEPFIMGLLGVRQCARHWVVQVLGSSKCESADVGEVSGLLEGQKGGRGGAVRLGVLVGTIACRDFEGPQSHVGHGEELGLYFKSSAKP